MKSHPALFLVLLIASAHAGPRSSTNYNVPTDTTDAGGTWEALTDFSDDGQNPDRIVIDQDATDPGKFYKVENAKP